MFTWTVLEWTLSQWDINWATSTCQIMKKKNWFPSLYQKVIDIWPHFQIQCDEHFCRNTIKWVQQVLDTSRIAYPQLTNRYRKGSLSASFAKHHQYASCQQQKHISVGHIFKMKYLQIMTLSVGFCYFKVRNVHW